MREVGVAGEDPRAMVEGTDGFFGEPPPEGGARDLSHEAPRNHLPSHFRRAPATQGDPATSWKLASQRLHLYPHRRGERSAACPSVVDPPVHLTPPPRTACAIWRPFEGWCKASGDLLVGGPFGGQKHDLRPHHLPVRSGVGAGSLAQDGALVFGGFDAERTLAGHISSPFSATRQPPRPYRERRTHQRSSVKDH